MKNDKRTVFCFPFSYENEKRIKLLKIQRKNLLNMKMVVSYLNFVFFIEVKTKSKYRFFNFVFQSIKKTKWHFGYTDSLYLRKTFVRLSRASLRILTGKKRPKVKLQRLRKIRIWIFGSLVHQINFF